jgi:hypothetical protein
MKRTFVIRHVPLIRFRHGLRDAAVANVPTVTSPLHGKQNEDRASDRSPILDSFEDLPPHLRPSPISAEEIDAVRCGGTFEAAAMKKRN